MIILFVELQGYPCLIAQFVQLHGCPLLIIQFVQLQGYPCLIAQFVQLQRCSCLIPLFATSLYLKVLLYLASWACMQKKKRTMQPFCPSTPGTPTPFQLSSFCNCTPAVSTTLRWNAHSYSSSDVIDRWGGGSGEGLCYI